MSKCIIRGGCDPAINELQGHTPWGNLAMAGSVALVRGAGDWNPAIVRRLGPGCQANLVVFERGGGSSTSASGVCMDATHVGMPTTDDDFVWCLPCELPDAKSSRPAKNSEQVTDAAYVTDASLASARVNISDALGYHVDGLSNADLIHVAANRLRELQQQVNAAARALQRAIGSCESAVQPLPVLVARVEKRLREAKAEVA